MENIYDQVEKNIDCLVENNADWTACATVEQMQQARNGQLNLKFFSKDVPSEWLEDIKGKKVLCLAGAGGLQAPLLACAGAEVTVLDISNKMLDKDREIAKNEKLQIEIIKSNMCDLSMFVTILMMDVKDFIRLYIKCLFVLKITMIRIGLNMDIQWKRI